MKKTTTKAVTLAALMGVALSTQAQQAKDVIVDAKGIVPYVIDQRGVVARSGAGLCWRTGYWTPQMAQEAKATGAQFPAGCECDKDLMPKASCEPPPPPPAPAAAPPVPAPAAAPVPPPAPAPAPAAKPISLAASALFAYDKAVLTPAGKAAIDKEVIARLGEFRKITFVLVTGHADRLGSQQYNQKLSEKRAEAVKGYLVEKGVEANIIETMGAGKTQPVPGVSCDDKLPRKKLIACLEPNRRVTVEIKGEPK